MPDANIVGLMQSLGFSEYEARAYVTLLQHSPVTGYELAKLSGIPRPNIYSVLPRLEERGAVVRLDTPHGARYAPVPPGELTRRLGDRFRQELASAHDALEAISTPAEREHVWNARGYDALVDHAHALINSARSDLLLAVWPQEAKALAGGIEAAEKRGVSVTTLCLAACARECGGCQGAIFRYSAAPQARSRSLVVVSDGAEMLAGEISPDGDATLARTRQRLLVELAAWYVRHSIALATITEDLGDRLPRLLSQRALGTLAGLGPMSGGWLEYMEEALRRTAVLKAQGAGAQEAQEAREGTP